MYLFSWILMSFLVLLKQKRLPVLKKEKKKDPVFFSRIK